MVDRGPSRRADWHRLELRRQCRLHLAPSLEQVLTRPFGTTGLSRCAYSAVDCKCAIERARCRTLVHHNVANAQFLQLCVDFVLCNQTFCPKRFQFEAIDDEGLPCQPTDQQIRARNQTGSCSYPCCFAFSNIGVYLMKGSIVRIGNYKERLDMPREQKASD